MNGGMNLRTQPSRVLVAYARPECFVDKTQAILSRLGYAILAPDELEAGIAPEFAKGAPHLVIADEHRLDDVPKDGDGAERPIILLTGRAGAKGDDPRVVAAVRKPAGLHDLYCILQRLFEVTPRATPRIPVHLEARCAQREQSFSGELLSISENGGLLRCDTDLSLGSRFDLTFGLPEIGSIELRAEAAYQLVPDIGIVFSGLEPNTRHNIADFVSAQILS